MATGPSAPAGDVDVEDPVTLTRAWPARVAVGALVAETVFVVVYLRAFVTRPLAFDEQWRGYFVSLGSNIIHHFDDIPAPMSAGWTTMERLVSRVLPNTEWSLRLPQIVALGGLAVATYVLARRWLPVVAAWAVAAALLLNGPLLVYGLLMKPFVFEAMCGVLVLVVWLWLDDAEGHERSTAAQLAGYAGIGLATVFAASALFVAVPLLALGLWRQRRGPRLGLTVAGSALAGVIAAVHLKFFFLEQGQLLKEPYWQSFFVPHSSAALSFLVDQVKGFAHLPTSSFLPPDTSDQYLAASVPPPSGWAALIGLAFVLLVAWGVVVAARSSAGRALLTATFGALAMQLAASWVEKWPFGMVRANLVLVPLLYVLVGLGVTDLVRRAIAAIGADATSSTHDRPLPMRIGLVAAAGLAVLMVVIAVAVSAQTVRAYKARYAEPLFVDRIRDVVRVVRAATGPDDVAIAVLDGNGWRYYSYFYDDSSLDGSGVARVPPERTLQVDDFLSPQINAFVDQHPDASRVLLFNFMGISPEYYDQQAAWMAERGFCPSRRWDFPQTGIVTEFTRLPGGPPAGACPEPVRQDVPPLTP